MSENLRRLLCSTDAETWAFLTCYARLCRRIGATRRIWPLWYLADAKDAGIMRNLTRRVENAHRYRAKTAMRVLLAAAPDTSATALAEHAADVLDRPDWLEEWLRVDVPEIGTGLRHPQLDLF